MTKSKISLLGSLFVAGALVAAGCGSSGGGGGTGGAAGAGTGGRGGSGSGGTGTGAGGADAGVAPAVNYTFTTTTQGWVLNNFEQTGNLDAPSSLDGGIDGGVAPTLTFDSTTGNPSPGSLKVTATFTDYNQYIDPIINFSSLDLTGKTLHAKVMLMSGTWPGYAVIHASSTSTYIYDAKGYGGLTAGAWTDLAFDLNTATTTGWMASQVVQLGIQVGTGAPPDAGVKLPAPIPVVLFIDTVTD
jgi:hypothetical protein